MLCTFKNVAGILCLLLLLVVGPRTSFAARVEKKYFFEVNGIRKAKDHVVTIGFKDTDYNMLQRVASDAALSKHDLSFVYVDCEDPRNEDECSSAGFAVSKTFFENTDQNVAIAPKNSVHDIVNFVKLRLGLRDDNMDSRDLYRRAVEASDQGDYMLASSLFRKALDANPTSPNACNNYAVALLRLGNQGHEKRDWRDFYREAARWAVAAQVLDPEMKIGASTLRLTIDNSFHRLGHAYPDEDERRKEARKIIAEAFADQGANNAAEDFDAFGDAEAHENEEEEIETPILDPILWDFLVANDLDSHYSAMFDYGVDTMDMLFEIDRSDMDAIGLSHEERKSLISALEKHDSTEL